MKQLKSILKFIGKIPVDKNLHFTYSALLAIIGSVIYPKGGGPILALGFGIVKEILDYRRDKENFNKADMIGDLMADLLGTFVGVLLFFMSIFSGYYIWGLFI